ncbi:hypothetical protein D3C71_1193790 [compost metagenome]
MLTGQPQLGLAAENHLAGGLRRQLNWLTNFAGTPEKQVHIAPDAVRQDHRIAGGEGAYGGGIGSSVAHQKIGRHGRECRQGQAQQQGLGHGTPRQRRMRVLQSHGLTLPDEPWRLTRATILTGCRARTSTTIAYHFRCMWYVVCAFFCCARTLIPCKVVWTVVRGRL